MSSMLGARFVEVVEAEWRRLVEEVGAFRWRGAGPLGCEEVLNLVRAGVAVLTLWRLIWVRGVWWRHSGRGQLVPKAFRRSEGGVETWFRGGVVGGDELAGLAGGGG